MKTKIPWQGLFLIAIGVFYFIGELNLINSQDLIKEYGVHMFLIYCGLVILVEEKRVKIIGLLLTLFAIYAIVDKINILGYYNMLDIFMTLLLIGIGGLYIIKDDLKLIFKESSSL